MTITQLINEVIQREGGYVHHPADKGGPTKYGITLKTLKAWRSEDLEARDVELLSKSEAFEIYHSEYYLKPGIGQLPELIQPVVFDMAVNMGAMAAIRIAQGVISKMGAPIIIDGRIGAKTALSAKIAVNVSDYKVVQRLSQARIEFYHDLVRRDPSQAVFLAGWLKRAQSFLA